MGYTCTWDTLNKMTHNTDTHRIHMHIRYYQYDDTQYTHTWDTHTHAIHTHMGDPPYTLSTIIMICVHIRVLIRPPKPHVHGASQILLRRRDWYSFSMCLIPKSLVTQALPKYITFFTLRFFLCPLGLPPEDKLGFSAIPKRRFLL